jgi:hypothetical protein
VCFFFGEISPLKKGWLNKLLLAVFFLAPWFEFELQITAPFRHSRDEEDEELSSSASSSSVGLQHSRVRRLSEKCVWFRAACIEDLPISSRKTVFRSYLLV